LSPSLFLSLCVRTGNSCSSPMAEAIMQNLMVKTSLYWEVDSAALRAWNIGRRPHKHCLRVLREHGLRSDHYCRLLTMQDFSYFDYIIPMNDHVHKELLSWASYNHINNLHNVVVLGAFGKNEKIIPVIDLSPTRKLKVFRSAYYNFKKCCKQLILSQNVKIVQYNLPSTDEEDKDDQYPKIIEITNSRGCNSSPAESMNYEYMEVARPSKTTSRSSYYVVNGQKKLCQNCGQKFLAML
ncbi:hypothetical protein KR222_001171, partial [Zaprionus bogoriensis]